MNKYFNESPNVSKYLEWGMSYMLRSKFNMTVPEVIQLLLVEHNHRAIAIVSPVPRLYLSNGGDITISSIARSAFTLST